MFRCKKCAGDKYKEWLLSWGPCEVCKNVGECSDC